MGVVLIQEMGVALFQEMSAMKNFQVAHIHFGVQ